MQLRILFLLVSCFATRFADAQFQLHVSPLGDDTAAGSVETPLASLIGARDRIRSMRRDQAFEKGIDVLIHAGRYEMDSTVEWHSQDSGTLDSPIRYRAVDGEVVLSGGKIVRNWQPLQEGELRSKLPPTAREFVRYADVSELARDAWNLHPRRLHEPIQPESIELFSGDRRLPRACWPNAGWAITQNVHGQSWSPSRTLSAFENSTAWAVGFWTHDWDASFEPVRILGSSQALSLVEDSARPLTKIREGARYQLCNVLSELDEPGEWYVDTGSNILLYWPISEGSLSAQPTVSIIETVLSLYDVEHVSFEGLRIEAARSMLVEVAGGANVRFRDCQFANAGNVAVHLFGGTEHALLGCEIVSVGSSAIRIEAGDRTSLIPSNHLIEGCDIHDFCQLFLAGRPGIAIYGVGSHILGNRVHHGPDVAIGIHGNDHRIEQNEITDVCTETHDTGAICLAYDPTYRGNQIRNNYIHDIGGFSKTGVIGIYLDDYASGTIVESNYLRNTVRGIAVGGGRDNRIEHNIIQGGLAAIQIDARGTTWYKSHVEGENSRIQQLCRRTLADSPVYAERYPELATMLSDEPHQPKGNEIRFNTFDCGIGVDLQSVNRNYLALENNEKKSTTDFGTPERILTQLGIRVLDRTQDKTDPETKLVNETRDAAQEVK